MAVVERLEPIRRERELKLQPTRVSAHYGIFRRDGRSFLQLDTYGSKARQDPGKQSQTLQFTEDSARELWAMLGREFGFSS